MSLSSKIHPCSLYSLTQAISIEADHKVLKGLVVSKFASNHQAVISVWFESHKWQCMETCSNMTLAVERDVKPKL